MEIWGKDLTEIRGTCPPISPPNLIGHSPVKLGGTNPQMEMGLHGLLDPRGTHPPKSSKGDGAQYLPEVRGP